MGNLTRAPAAAQPTALQSLMQMGFSEQASTNALSLNQQNFDLALQMLIDQRQVEERNKRADAAMLRNNRSVASQLPRVNKAPMPRSAPKIEMEESVPANPLTQIEDQAQAIDTLYYVLSTIVENPTEPKYRSLKTSNPRFKATLTQDPRVFQQVDRFLMRECGFEKSGEYYALAPNCDFDKVIHARDLLQIVRNTSDKYMVAKQRNEFEQVIAASQETATKEEEARRSQFALLLPPEPDLGEAGTTRIQVIISNGGKPMQRRFASHDTLRSVVHFVGSQRSLIGQQLETNKSWVMVDETLLEKRVLRDSLDKTLFALNLWPSATLHVRLLQE